MNDTQTYEVGATITTPAAMFNAPYGTVATDAQGFTYRTIGTPLGTTYIQIRSEELGTQVELHPHMILEADLHLPFEDGVWTVTTAALEPGVFWGRTEAEWKEQARDCLRRREESWERSDTDGFMTQWANQEMASRYENCASVAEMGGTEVIWALFDLAGNYVPSRKVETQYGWSWGVWENGHFRGRFDSWFNASNAKNPDTARANNAKKGYYIGKIRVRAIMDRSNMIYPTDELVEIVDNGVDPVVYGADE